jgi:hypothetical protein
MAKTTGRISVQHDAAKREELAGDEDVPTANAVADN